MKKRLCPKRDGWKTEEEENEIQGHRLSGPVPSIYGVSAERVRQLEKNAMKKLRAAIEA